MNSASYEYRNMSGRRGTQLVSIGMPTTCWKIFPPKITKLLSTRNSSMLVMSSSVYLLFESECSLTKYGPLRPKTKNLYLQFPFFVHERVPNGSLPFRFLRRIEKSKDLMLVTRLEFGDLRCSNNSFEFLRIHI